MQRKTRKTSLALAVLAALFLAGPAPSQGVRKVTTPKEHFGFNIGDDYQVANYTQLEEYWKKLAAESDRMKLQSIGLTAEGRPQYMAIISSPDNLKKLDRYRDIARRLALAEGLTDDQARALAQEGKAVVWIDGGLHATETVGAQQLIEWVYQMNSRTDPETLRFLNDVIVLNVHANPDGMELVSNWYMREPDPLKRSLTGLPRLYEKYAGHDNNRDFYMSNLPETANMNRILYQEWLPQIMYNHHQTGPRGAVIFVPPFRDPFNYNFDPLVPIMIEQVGTAMHGRMIAEGKFGSAMRGAASYSTWYNGGLRTTTYFHNMIGILTEIIGSPTPMEIPLVPERQLPSGDEPAPIPPRKWHYRESIEYSMTANRAILDYASRWRETLLFNIYKMGKNSIERGSKDTWTVTPKRIEALRAEAAKVSGGGRRGGGAAAGTEGPPAGDSPEAGPPRGGASMPTELYQKVLQDPAKRDPRGYILPSDQPDFPTAVKFANILIKTGITVHRAPRAFQVAGKSYPAGSIVIKSAQAFRPHVIDMFEPQDHPNDLRYPGGPPIPPYDNAGWTLAFQMGVQFDRILDGFDGPFEKVNGLIPAPVGTISGPSAAPAGYLISHSINDAFILTNRLLKEKADVYWMKGETAAGDRTLAPGAIWVPHTKSARAVLEQSAKQLGVNVTAVARPPSGEAFKLKPVRIGLIDQYGGSMPSGWTRYIFENFEFPYEVVFPAALDAGDLRAKFDVLVFVNAPVGRAGAGGGFGGGGGGQGQLNPERVPAEYRHMLGRITEDRTIPQLRKFVESGGAIVAIGRSSQGLADLLNVPAKNPLVDKTADGRERPLSRDKFYIPGSVLAIKIDNTHPLAYGLGNTVDVFYENSPVFQLADDAKAKGVTPVGWFDSKEPLRSGWALGQERLEGTVGMAEAKVGEGKLFLLGPEVTFRAQPHGTFKFLFNGIYYGTATAAKVGPTD